MRRKRGTKEGVRGPSGEVRSPRTADRRHADIRSLQRTAGNKAVSDLIMRSRAGAPDSVPQVQRLKTGLEGVATELESLVVGSGSRVHGAGYSPFARIVDAVVSYERAVKNGASSSKVDTLLASIDQLASEWVNSHRGTSDERRRHVLVGLLERLAPLRRYLTQSAAHDETVRHLTAEVKAAELINAAVEVEPEVTARILRLAESRGGKTEGLDYRFKSEESLTRKLEDRARTTVSSDGPAAAVKREAAKISDVLRYTVIVPSERYKQLADDVTAEMKAFGYSPGKVNNAWATSTTYKGLNLIFIAKDSRGAPMPFELQLHTEDTFATKQEIHEMYEEARAAGTHPKRRAELDKLMAARWKRVPVPAGIKSI